MRDWLSINDLVQSTLAEHQALSFQDPGRGSSYLNVADTVDLVLAEPGNAAIPAGGVDAAAAPASGGGGLGLSWQTTGMIMAGAGAASAAIGAFFEVKSQQNRMKAQALSLEHEATMSAIAARSAEREAQSIIEASHQQIGAVTMQAGADAGARAAVMAGRGVRLGVGSAAAVQASGALIRDMDVMAIGVNAARGAADARTSGTNMTNRAMFARMSASNLRRSAGNDFAATSGAFTSLLNSGSRIGSQWATDRRNS